MIEAILTLGILVAPASISRPSPEIVEHEAHVIATVAAMTDEEQVALFLGRGQSRDSSSQRHQEKERVGRFLGDPALSELFSAIQADWFKGTLTEFRSRPPLFWKVKELVQLKAMIARNLYFRGLESTRSAVRQECRRIARLRNRYRNTRIFEDRDVLYAASGAVRRIGSERSYIFGRSPAQRLLRGQAGSFVFIRATEHRARARLLQRIREEQTLTLLFEGHGRRDALRFDGGWSASRLARGLAGRSENEPSILVLSACQSHTFARLLLETLRHDSPGTPLPLVITPSEYGQDYFKSVYNDRFLQRELGLWKGAVSLGDLLERASLTTSVYVPDSNNTPTQIL